MAAINLLHSRRMAGLTIGGDTLLGHQMAVELTDIGQKTHSAGRRSLTVNQGLSEQSSIGFDRTDTPQEGEIFTNSLVNPPGEMELSMWTTAIIIGTVSTITMLNSMLSGLLVVALPTMATDLGLPSNLILWPTSVNASV